MAPDEITGTAELLERLLTDAGYRALFRNDPVAACREAGLGELADELAGRGSAMQTLELRESKSSLAGLVLAAAAEGIGVYALLNDIGPFLRGDAAAAVERALTLPRLGAIKGALVDKPSATGGVTGGVGAGAALGVEAPPGGDAAAPVGNAWPTASAADPELLAVAEPKGGAAVAAAEQLDSSAPALGGATGTEAPVEALLDNPAVDMPPAARQDLESGAVDPRVVAMLGKLAEKHEIGISVLKTGHDKFVAGTGSVSNHFHGRGVDIASVDGRPVNPANPAARELATELAELDPSIRPTEVGTPWPIAATGFFSDAGHQTHIHIGFDDPPPAGLELPGAAHAAHAGAAHAAHAGAAAEAEAVDARALPLSKGASALELAKRYLGTPYRWGGETPQTGFDCSGLTQYVYGKLGVDLPRVAEDQFHAGTAVARGDLRPGDLVFFQDASGYIHHMGMYAGDGKFLHAPHTGDVVKMSSLDEPYYDQQFAGARRVAPAAEEAAAEPSPAPSRVPEPSAAPKPLRSDTAVFEAVARQEASWHRQTAQFLRAVEDRPAWAHAHAAGAGGAGIDLGDAPGDYPGDGAPREQLARWMAAEAKKAGLPPELPVMASLVESNLKNLNFGDRDSVGFFQMRTGIWNKGAYAGYPQRPELQLKWFIDQALGVKRQWLAAGRAGDLTDPGKRGEWIADVERPAEQYRGRYQLKWSDAQRLLRG